MKNLIKIIGLITLTAFLFTSCGGDSGSKAETEYGQNLQLADLQGKVVIVDFWATWCPPCRKGIPDLVDLKKEYNSDQLEIVGVSLDGITRGGATANDVAPFIKEYGINYPIVKGGQDVVMQYGGIQSIPTSFVIDRRGYVVARFVGLVAKESYKDAIEEALAGNYAREDYVKAPTFSLPTVKAD